MVIYCDTSSIRSYLLQPFGYFFILSRIIVFFLLFSLSFNENSDIRTHNIFGIVHITIIGIKFWFALKLLNVFCSFVLQIYVLSLIYKCTYTRMCIFVYIFSSFCMIYSGQLHTQCNWQTFDLICLNFISEMTCSRHLCTQYAFVREKYDMEISNCFRSNHIYVSLK